MDVQLILTTLLAFIFIPLHLSFSRKLQRYVKCKYPKEWANVSSNRMKMNIKNIRHVALNDSLKYGFLSQQNDPVIIRFLKFEKLSNSIGLTLIMVGFLFAWFQ
jgi:hypothetical protein